MLVFHSGRPWSEAINLSCPALRIEHLRVNLLKAAVVNSNNSCPLLYELRRYKARSQNYRNISGHIEHSRFDSYLGALSLDDRIDYSIIPSVIYTTPEVACVGETEQSAKEKGLDVQIVKAPMALSGRYLAENPKGDGFCKLLYDRKNLCVVGVHLVGSYASEIIYGAAMMVHSKLPVQHLDKIVFPHPTVGEVVREALFLL